MLIYAAAFDVQQSDKARIIAAVGRLLTTGWCARTTFPSETEPQPIKQHAVHTRDACAQAAFSQVSHLCHFCISFVNLNARFVVKWVLRFDSFVWSCTGYPAPTLLLKGIAAAPEVQEGDWQITQSNYQRLLLFQTMETTPDLRTATLNTRMHLTTARRVRSCPTSPHSHAPALLVAMDLQPSRETAFTRIPGISPAPLSIEAIIMKKCSIPLTWTWHGVIMPSNFRVRRTDMSIPLCPITEGRDLCLQIPGCPPPRPVMTIGPAVSRHKSWMNSSSRGIGAVSSKLPGPVPLTDREPSDLKTPQARRPPIIRARSTMNR